MKKIKVLAGGRFNILHEGHIYFLEKAKSLGDYLIVVIANDKTVLRNKKPLLFSQEIRKKRVEKLYFVDKVIIGDPKNILKTVEKVRPDIIALGYDDKIKESELRKKLKERGLNCKIVRVPELVGFSTRKILKKIKI